MKFITCAEEDSIYRLLVNIIIYIFKHIEWIFELSIVQTSFLIDPGALKV